MKTTSNSHGTLTPELSENKTQLLVKVRNKES